MNVDMADLEKRIMARGQDVKQLDINILFHFAMEDLQNRLTALEKGKPEPVEDDEVAKTQDMLEQDSRLKKIFLRHGCEGLRVSRLNTEIYLLGEHDGQEKAREVSRNERL